MVAQGWIAEGYGPGPGDHVRAVERTGVLAAAAVTSPNPKVAAAQRAARHVRVESEPPCGGVPDRARQRRDRPGPTLCGASLVLVGGRRATKGVYDWSAVTRPPSHRPTAALTVNFLFSKPPRRGQHRHAGMGDAAGRGAARARPQWRAPASRRCRCTSTRPTRPRGRPSSPRRSIEFSNKNSALAGASATCASPPAAARRRCRRRVTTTAGRARRRGSGRILVRRVERARGPASSPRWDAAHRQADRWRRSLRVGGPERVRGGELGAAGGRARRRVLFENLGVNNVATPRRRRRSAIRRRRSTTCTGARPTGTTWGRCRSPLQPITATTSTSQATMDISKLLQYALDNEIQILELYPEELLQADSPASPGSCRPNRRNTRQRYRRRRRCWAPRTASDRGWRGAVLSCPPSYRCQEWQFSGVGAPLHPGCCRPKTVMRRNERRHCRAMPAKPGHAYAGCIVACCRAGPWPVRRGGHNPVNGDKR